MKVGSMFAGIGGFDLGFERAGFDVAWCIELDKNAQAVLRKRFPKATVYGDIREVDPAQLERVDVVCGGFPCQDLSVAGKRAGLAGERSGLFHDAMRIVRRLRPSVLILENVPGLLSSNRGLDFATVLREVGEGWDCAEVAWRVLDSRYFGVAQRRRRVFVVAGSRIGCAEQVLALAEGVRWHPAARDEAREDAPIDATRCIAGSGKDESVTVVGTIDCHIPKQRAQNARQGHYIPIAIQGNLIGRDAGGPQGIGVSDSGTMYTMTKTDVHGVAFRKSRRAQNADDHETWVDDGTANTLNGFDTGDTRTTHAVAFGISNQPTPKIATDICPSLDAKSGGGGRVEAVAFNWQNGGGYGNANEGLGITHDGTGPLQRCQTPAVATGMVVRRLTPTECERLQGFPDGWTQIGTPDKPTADTHRYKQLGNAVTVNVAQWIARRTAKALA